MDVVMLQFRGLGVRELGCYGGAAATPAFDELASCADLYEHFYWDDEHPPESPCVTHRVSASSTSSALYQEMACDACVPIVNHIGVVCDASSDRLDLYGSVMKAVLEHRPPRAALVVTGEMLPDLGPQLPLLVSLPDQTESRRRRNLLTTADLGELTTALLQGEKTYQNWRDQPSKSQIAYRAGAVTAVRTRDWLLTLQDDSCGDSRPQLFRQPEDLWQILDVATQHPDLMEHFEATGALSFPRETSSPTI